MTQAGFAKGGRCSWMLEVFDNDSTRSILHTRRKHLDSLTRILVNNDTVCLNESADDNVRAYYDQVSLLEDATSRVG